MDWKVRWLFTFAEVGLLTAACHVVRAGYLWSGMWIGWAAIIVAYAEGRMVEDLTR